MGTKAVERFSEGRFVANLTLENQEEPPFVCHLFVIERDGSTMEPGNGWHEGTVVAVRDFPPGEEPNHAHVRRILQKMESDSEYFEKFAVEQHQGSGVW